MILHGGMAEGISSSYPEERQRSNDSPRGERSPGGSQGGYIIFLSDNEMRSALALQAAFGLRSTVAVLGFALRTLGQQLEEGKLENLVSEHWAQGGARAGGEVGRRVLSQAVEVLGSIDKARLWLKTPNRALGCEMPLDLLDTDIGTRQVEEVLLRLNYGIFS
jgi:hypothetical protein